LNRQRLLLTAAAGGGSAALVVAALLPKRARSEEQLTWRLAIVAVFGPITMRLYAKER